MNRVEKIDKIDSANKSNAERSEYDRWSSLENFRALDDRLNARAGYRNALGMTQEEYDKQARESEKQGFDAILSQKIKE